MRRLIDKIWYDCIDVGCSDFDAAARNRERVRTHSHMIWWAWYKEVIRTWGSSRPFPWWIPHGELPKVGKHEMSLFPAYGIYKIGDDGLLKIDTHRNYSEDVDE